MLKKLIFLILFLFINVYCGNSISGEAKLKENLIQSVHKEIASISKTPDISRKPDNPLIYTTPDMSREGDYLLLYFATKIIENFEQITDKDVYDFLNSFHLTKNKNTYKDPCKFLDNSEPELSKLVDCDKGKKHKPSKKDKEDIFNFVKKFLEERKEMIRQQDNELFIHFIKKLQQSLNGKTLVLPSPSDLKSFKAVFVLLANNPEKNIKKISKLERQCIKTLKKNPKNKFAQLLSSDTALGLIHEFVPEYDVFEWEMYNALIHNDFCQIYSNIYKMHDENKVLNVLKKIISYHDNNFPNIKESYPTYLFNQYYRETSNYILDLIKSCSFSKTYRFNPFTSIFSNANRDCWIDIFWLVQHWIEL